MMSSKQDYPLLPVFSLLFTATLWGLVWYPLRLLEHQGLAGPWSALISYGTILAVFLWVLIRDRQPLLQHFLPLACMSLAAGWCNVAFIMAVLDGHVVRVLLLFYLSPFWKKSGPPCRLKLTPVTATTGQYRAAYRDNTNIFPSRRTLSSSLTNSISAPLWN